MMLSAIVLAAQITGTIGRVDIPGADTCRVMILGKQLGQATNKFVGGADGGGIWIGSVGDTVTAGTPGMDVITQFWLWALPATVVAGNPPPDLILPVTPGERVVVPPVTDLQRRECGGAVS